MDQGETTVNSIPTIRFTNIEDLVTTKRQQGRDDELQDMLRVTNVALADFKKIDEEYEWNKTRISQYFEDSQTMMVTVSTIVHEQLHYMLCNYLENRLADIGLKRAWIPSGAVTCYSPGFHSGSGNGSAGSADSSFQTRSGQSEQGRRRSFPILMIDAGCAQPLASMRAKAEWWFRMSNHEIKTVLLAKLEGSQRAILLERWEERQEEREGNGEAEWVASCQQAIAISESEADAGPPLYEVAGGDLVLDLQLLLLENASKEGRFLVLTQEDLQGYAKDVMSEWTSRKQHVSR